ncbi:unnamed protein product [Effrenium voratum]|nr:unnamed protein product [Effrenium voratum]
MTWGRGSLKSLNVWTLDGKGKAFLRTESPLVQVDVARVTWQSVYTLDHFILCALDSRSVVTFWDSKEDFAPIFRFYCGCEEPFDLVLTQDFLVVINDNISAKCLDLCFLKLWFHPDFEAGPDSTGLRKSEAQQQREASVQRSRFPAGARFAPQGGILPAGAAVTGLMAGLDLASAAAAQLSGDTLQRFLYKELRPNCRPIKTLSIPDIDTYFASYRNFLNMCSFHKSGQESLSVYRSSSLQKKVFFPPAKHTKFEEWLALQVHNDGTVVVHDFRPHQMAFDELDSITGLSTFDAARAAACVEPDVPESLRDRALPLARCDVQVHAVTRRLARDFEGLFPDRQLLKEPHVLVTLALQTKHRQSAMSAEMLSERQVCYEKLVTRMQAFKQHFDSLGRWCDFIDPSTGAPFHSDSSTTLLECDECYRRLGFEILELGCCKALCNKRFGQCLVMTTAFVQGEDVEAALPLLDPEAEAGKGEPDALEATGVAEPSAGDASEAKDAGAAEPSGGDAPEAKDAGAAEPSAGDASEAKDAGAAEPSGGDAPEAKDAGAAEPSAGDAPEAKDAGPGGCVVT